MSIKISNCRLSYILFSLFIASVIVFVMHKGFEMIDILTIPVFALILFLIIDFSANLLFEKNMERFMVENFQSNQLGNLGNFNNVPQLSRIPGNSPAPSSLTPSQSINMAPSSLSPSSLSPSRSPSPSLFPNMIANTAARVVPIGGLSPSMSPSLSPAIIGPTGKVEVVLADTGRGRSPSPSPSISSQNKDATDQLMKKMVSNKKQLVGAPVASNKKRDFNERRLMNRKKIYEEADDMMINDNEDSEKPININVSYNNNRPINVNAFDNGRSNCGAKADSYRRNTRRAHLDRGGNRRLNRRFINDINRYQDRMGRMGDYVDNLRNYSRSSSPRSFKSDRSSTPTQDEPEFLINKNIKGSNKCIEKCIRESSPAPIKSYNSRIPNNI